MTHIKYENCSIKGKGDVREELFQIELENFPQFHCCPRSFLEYRNSFPSFPLLVTSACSDERMIGCRILMHISRDLLHNMLIVVRNGFRRTGIGRAITLRSNRLAFDLGYQYISEFSMSLPISLRLNCMDLEGKEGLMRDDSPITNPILAELKSILKNDRINVGNIFQERYYVLNGGKHMDAHCLIYNLNELSKVFPNGRQEYI